MSKWLLRGLVFAALMIFIRLVQGAAINAWETKAGLISVTLVVLFAIAVFVWGYFDGRSDARANPDPDRRDDLAMTWLLAGLFAGIVSGAIAWLISLFYKGLYVGGLINELTTFAAFTALLIFLGGDRRRCARTLAHRPACRRRSAPAPRPRRGGPRRARTAPTPTCSPLSGTRTRPPTRHRPSGARNRPSPARRGNAARAGNPAHRVRR